MSTNPSRQIFPILLAFGLVPLFTLCHANVAKALGCIAQVNSTDDSSDVDGCNLIHCSFREAIALVNSDPNDNINSICFNLAETSPTIILNTPLPDLFTSMTVHSPNIPNPTGKIVINGSKVGGVGLRITEGDVTIHHLIIQYFDVGIQVQDGGRLRLGSSFIGTNATGNAPAPNRIGMNILTANNSIGKSFISGTQITDGNVISGNTEHGISIEGPLANHNLIAENLIGTKANGAEALGNGGHGIQILDAEYNLIQGNTLSGNGQDGILIWGDGANGNKVLGNLIGLKANGNGPLENNRDGVRISRVIQHPDVPIQDGGPSHNTIGGPNPGERNIISGNGEAGITLEGKNTSLNKVYGNFIGTDLTGTQARGNGTEGIHITLGEASQESLPKPGPPINNTIGAIEGTTTGGACTGGCNLISGNGADGIRIDGVEVSGNNILANFIGVDVSGTKALPNQGHGVAIAGAHKNHVGDYPVQSGEPNPHRNLISGNTGFGIYIFGGLAKNNQVLGNFIGTDTTGNAPLGNTGGILVEFSNGNLLGDGAESSGNLISGNAGDGIVINDSHNTFIQNNKIGVNAEGLAPLPNQGHGINIINASTANSIGGENSGQGNHIAFNQGDGVRVSGLRNMEIIGNSIHDNTGMGIDLAPIGVNVNDVGDVDEGVNESQNFPELTSVVPLTLEIEVQGILQGLSNRQYRLHFYSNESCDEKNHGQGHYYLGLGVIHTDTEGKASFATVLPRVGGEMITATATDDSRNTSEFSDCLKVGTGPGVDLDLDGVPNTDDNCIDDPNQEQGDQDGDQVGDACDICPDMSDTADFDFNQVPDCLELFVRGAGTTCSLSPATPANPWGPWLMGLGLVVILMMRFSTTIQNE